MQLLSTLPSVGDDERSRDTKSLSPERLAHARAFIDAIVKRDFTSPKAAANAWGLAQSSFSEFLRGVGGTGLKTLEAAADHERVLIDQVIGRSPPGAVRIVASREEPLPERERGVRAARELGYSEEAIANIQAAPLVSHSAREWLSKIIDEDARLLTSKMKPPPPEDETPGPDPFPGVPKVVTPPAESAASESSRRGARARRK